MSPIVVSIFMLTYNQENYIEQSIESILIQRANFSFQLVIGEDCSTDATRSICEKYAAAHPRTIKLLPALDKNIGLIANYMRTIKECDGKYIAICDGDDYWIDELKLQNQVDFLEKNQDYSIVYTALRRLYSDGTMMDYNYHLDQLELDFDDLIFDNFIYSVTAMFRNVQPNENSFPSWIINFPFGDWQTYLWVVKDGSKIHFMNDITAVYRMNIGVSSAYMKKNSVFIEILIHILEHVYNDNNFNHKKEIITSSIYNRKKDLLTSFNREKSYFKGFLLFVNIFKTTHRKLQFIKFYLYSICKSFR